MSVLNLNDIRPGTPPLYLHPDGRFSLSADQVANGLEAGPAIIRAARWVSGRRTVSFERLYPVNPFKSETPRNDSLSEAQGKAMLGWLKEIAGLAAASGAAAQKNLLDCAEIRSAILTILSHHIATVLRKTTWRPLADLAAEQMLAMVDAETGPNSWPSLRAHAIYLLQLRGAALSATHRSRATTLLRGLVRNAPPYSELKGVWNFAMCSAWDFHEGECKIMLSRGFREIPSTLSSPRGAYRCFEAPFKNPNGEAIRVYARSASPNDENLEMGNPAFVGLLINRHAQLGSFDMRAAASNIKQQGYKLMMNSQCAGLTTRFAISRLFPEADIYSSWDSTFFRTAPGGSEIIASEGMDCFLALLQGMAAGEDHSHIAVRMQKVQWRHEQSSTAGFMQFIGPSNPLVLGRYQDVNQDGRADMYDGFLDLQIKNIAENMLSAGTPKDPGVPASAIGGDAATGLDWATGSINRVTQYSELWDELPGLAEGLYAFSSGGFYDDHNPPADVQGLKEDPGLLPAICRYQTSGTFAAEVSLHSWLSDVPKELKRLIATAEAMNRAFDIGVLKAPSLAYRRGAVLITLAGLLEFPADQNRLDAMWAIALHMLNFPEISRSTVRACITEEDHKANNYYGSRRGIKQLLGTGTSDRGALGASDPVSWNLVNSEDPKVGRAKPLPIRSGKISDLVS